MVLSTGICFSKRMNLFAVFFPENLITGTVSRQQQKLEERKEHQKGLMDTLNRHSNIEVE